MNEQRRQALAHLQELANDPELPAEVVAETLLQVLHRQLSYGCWNNYQRDGRGAALVDLRRFFLDGGAPIEYALLETLQSVVVEHTVFTEVAEALGAYDPERELVAVFLQAGGVHWFRVERLRASPLPDQDLA